MDDLTMRSGHRYDPIDWLNIDCMNIIFTYLLPADVLRCEIVNKNWRNHARSWMVSFGIRLHCYPYLVDTNVSKTVKCYKELAPQASNLRLGMSTSARRFPDSKITFEFAGHYAARIDNNNDIRWYHLQRYGDLSSIDPPMGKFLTLPEKFHVQNNCMNVNSEGYVFTRLATLQRSGLHLRDAVFHLSSGNIIWRQDYKSKTNTLSDQPKVRPLLIGQSQIYFFNKEKHRLVAHEFRTGRFVYSIRLKRWRPGSVCKFELMYDKDDEIIMQMNTKRRINPGIYITLINGASGNRIQAFKCTQCPLIYLTTISPKNSSFTVVNILKELTTHVVVVAQRYSRQSDGSFDIISRDALLLPGDAMDFTLHPFYSVGFSHFYEGSDRIWKALTLAQTSDPAVPPIVNSTFELNSMSSEIDRYFCVVEMNDVTLPPHPSALETNPKRERFIMPWSPHETRLFDGRQLVVVYEVAARVISF